MTRLKTFILLTAIFVLPAALACMDNGETAPAPAEAVNADEAKASKQTDESPSKQEALSSDCKALESLPEDKRPVIPKDAAVREVTKGSGSLAFPVPGAPSDGETHTRHPWKMPRGASNALAVVRWDDTSWGDVEFSLGTGICPHRGLKLAQAISNTGLAVVSYVHSPDRAWPEPNWFLHVNADKALADKAGQELKYSYEICAY